MGIHAHYTLHILSPYVRVLNDQISYITNLNPLMDSLPEIMTLSRAETQIRI